MHIGQRAIRLISHFEGRANYCYADPIGLATVGVGHLLKPPRRPTRQDFHRYGTKQRPKMTDAHVDRILRRDLRAFEEGVRRLVRKDTLSFEFEAMVSLAFNIGLGAFADSTVLKHHNAGRSFRAGAWFMRYVFGTVNGRKVKFAGLVRRRRAERWLYRKGTVKFF